MNEFSIKSKFKIIKRRTNFLLLKFLNIYLISFILFSKFLPKDFPSFYFNFHYFTFNFDNNKEFKSLTETVLSYPWDSYGFQFKNFPISLREQLFRDMTNWVELEPLEPINETCEPPKLPDFEDIDCSKYPSAFTGKKRTKYAKIGHAIQLGFDVDILEIHLNELYPIVDKIFIAEAKYTHFDGIEKPFVWEEIKDTPRFSKFNDKVVHIKINNPNMSHNEKGTTLWFVEGKQEKERWKRIKEWNEKHHYFDNDDVIGFGDADEICAMKNLQLLRTCEFNSPVDIGTWFTHGMMERKFFSNYPVPGYPDTLGDPIFFTWEQAMNSFILPNRMRGKSGRFLLGGMHISLYEYLPNCILKQMSQTENAEVIFNLIRKGMKRNLPLSVIERSVRSYVVNSYNSYFPLISKKQIGKDQFIVPWFLECNKKRFPSLYDNKDYEWRYELKL